MGRFRMHSWETEDRQEEHCKKCDNFFTPWITNCKCPRRTINRKNMDKLLNSLKEGSNDGMHDRIKTPRKDS